VAIATLPIVLSVVLTELAVGGSFLGWWVDRGGRAPTGFLKLVAFVDAGAIAAALALVPLFPRGDLAEAASINTGPLGAFGQALIVVTILVIIQLITAFLPARGIRIASGIVTTVAGVLTLAVVALATRPAESTVDPLAFAAMPLGAIALGGADGAMLLGHWYLVTPRLSPAPLRRASLTVVAAVALQIGLVAGVVLRGDLNGTWDTALFVALALRIGVGLFMTLVIALAAWWTAGMNTQSSTGLLYVALGCAFAGEVSARVFFFLTGLPN
jgi:hypothetical protein